MTRRWSHIKKRPWQQRSWAWHEFPRLSDFMRVKCRYAWETFSDAKRRSVWGFSPHWADARRGLTVSYSHAGRWNCWQAANSWRRGKEPEFLVCRRWLLTFESGICVTQDTIRPSFSAAAGDSGSEPPACSPRWPFTLTAVMRLSCLLCRVCDGGAESKRCNVILLQPVFDSHCSAKWFMHLEQFYKIKTG